ncbi:hypothetical protein DFS33DRAFT_1355746 [Desarmillaria ectypa]|nr:hypothetical protein DFS33DRAFT_1355746 [Desarmillaria ectypa]
MLVATHCLPLHRHHKLLVFKLSAITMCTQQILKYTCGCKHNGAFQQCAERTGTNVRCEEISNEIDNIDNYCKEHTVSSTK